MHILILVDGMPVKHIFKRLSKALSILPNLLPSIILIRGQDFLLLILHIISQFVDIL